MIKRNKLNLIAAAIFLLTLGTNGAWADTMFDLSAGNTAISSYPGPYAQVDVSLSGQVATVTFTSLTNGGNIYLMGDGGSADLNVNSSNFTVSAITGSNGGTGFQAPSFSTGSGNVDGFGSFNLTISNFDGFDHALDTISFMVTNNDSLNPWSSSDDVLTPNDPTHNAEAAAHIFVTSDPAVQSNGAKATGFAAGNCSDCGGITNTEITPEPTSIVLLGTIFIGLTSRLRKKTQQSAG